MSKKDIDNYNSQNSLYSQDSEKYIHILVRDNNQPQPQDGNKGLELGSAKIVIDELIDTNLNDLAKQFCVCLNRSHILKKMLDSGKYPKNIEMFTQFSGIVKFQTLFQPNQDTCLRFQKLKNTQGFVSPK